MNPSVFLDTVIFFKGMEHARYIRTLEHALHLGYEIHTSITVIGEAVSQMHEKKNAMDYIKFLNDALDTWNIAVHYPNDYVRVLCYQLGEEEIDTRMIREPTDRTHLAYAMAYHIDYFLTTDPVLIKYRVPQKIQDAGFLKPDTMNPETFRTTILKVSS